MTTNMTLEKNYDASSTEQRLYDKWETSGYFKAQPESEKDPFCIMIPPPNVTGQLHVGHALTMTLQDILTRHARMIGKDALWQPGTDHASIAVERLVCKQLADEGIADKKEIGREKFLEKTWEWKEKYGNAITGQLRRLGASCDWSRERFTMDEGCNKAVNKVFVDLYNRGLIYRGTRLVNWDPNHKTAVSDNEVRHVEIEGGMWHLKYPLTDGSGHLIVATTRPETMLGDTCVIVHPDDERYKDLVGKTITLPLVGREIPIIADDYVDMEFGTGCMKVTPAHDFNDYEIGKRHNQEMINVFTADAHINDNAPEKYRGMDRLEARKQVVADFEAEGLLEKHEKHMHNVAHAERDETILEPFLTTQWYVKTESFAKKALEVLKSGELEFVPKNWEKTYLNWVENMHDWCISRQLWWGHQIPVWYKGDEIYCGEAAPEGEGWVQDEDTLDTWFSSGMWPFSTLGWPNETPELKKYYPTSVLVTGFDIIFFWVVRMVMFGTDVMGEVPFKKVFIHALVRDEHGQKMSKSKGNVLDPIELIEEFGTDALRYTIGSMTAPGADIALGKSKIEASRNFCTKLWNASRFALMNDVKFDENFDPMSVQHPVNKWALASLADLIDVQNKAYEDYRFNDLSQALYHFTWDTYCSWYLELTKPMVYGEDEALIQETRDTLGYVLEKTLRLMHPVMPFITEEIWTALTGNTESSLMIQEWPTTDGLPRDEVALADVNWLTKVISGLRQARSENNVPNKAGIAACVRGYTEEDMRRLSTFETFIAAMTKVSGFEAREEVEKTDVVAVAEGFEIILPLEGIVDFEAEKERVQKEIAKFEAELSKINGMLGNENFVARAPEHVVAEQQSRKNEIMADLSKLKQVLEARV